MELFGKYGSEFRKFKYSFEFHSIYFWNIQKPKISEIENAIYRFNFGKNWIGFQKFWKFRTFEHLYLQAYGTNFQNNVILW